MTFRQVLKVGVALALGTAFAVAADKPEAKAKVGEPAPLFELTSADGKTFKLADLQDKVVVLEWCSKDCPFSHMESGREALPKMKTTASKYAEKGVVWLGIDSTSFHNASDVAEFSKEKEIPYPILMDTDGKVGHAYGARTTPHIFIINKGKLVYAGAHDDKGERNYIAESLDAVLAGKDVPVAETKSYGCSVKYAQGKKPA